MFKYQYLFLLLLELSIFVQHSVYWDVVMNEFGYP